MLERNAENPEREHEMSVRNGPVAVALSKIDRRVSLCTRTRYDRVDQIEAHHAEPHRRSVNNDVGERMLIGFETRNQMERVSRTAIWARGSAPEVFSLNETRHRA